MKKFITISILLFVTMIMPSSVRAAESTSYELILEQYSDSDSDPDNFGDGNDRRRKRPNPIHCIISSNGVIINSGEYDEINTFEIYNKYGELIMITDNEEDFISYIFICSESVEIHFHIGECLLVGALQI